VRGRFDLEFKFLTFVSCFDAVTFVGEERGGGEGRERGLHVCMVA